MATHVVQPEWLSVLNSYRTMSNLAPVTMNSSWSDADRNHACYMTLNGMGHDELPTKPGYTSSGDTAAALSNIAVNTALGLPDRYWLELWLTGPFHAIGLLRHNLLSVGYGDCENPSTYWHSAAALNVIAGLGNVTRPAAPIVFPGNGATTTLDRFIAETPSPVEMCGWSGEAGLPLIAMLPEAPSGTVSASLSGPGGALQVCPLWSGNTPAGWGRDTLRGDNAVVVVPRARLQPGVHTATVRAGTRVVTWSFVVDPAAPSITSVPSASPIGAPSGYTPLAPTRILDTRQADGGGRLTAGTVRRISVAGRAGVVTGSTGVAINVTAVRPAANGFLTAYPCTASQPAVSSVNFRAGQTIANLAHVSLAADGALCVVSSAATDVVIDVAGAYGPGGTHALRSLTPLRLLDTRTNGARLAAGSEYSIDPQGNTAAGDAVEVSVVATAAVAAGYLTLWPCGQPKPTVSNLNYETGGARSNHAVVFVGDGGLCVASSTDVHVVVDLNGVMSTEPAARFTATAPFRLVDTRSLQFEALQAGFGGSAVPGGATVRLTAAGARGIPSGVSALVVNITVVGAGGGGWVTVWPCGTASTASTMNYDAAAARASAAVLTVSPSGSTCVLTSQTAHVLIDVVGWWS
ncbi:MAG TPA: hypothetical protein VMS14_10625 [Ilumatobacteraceae bacterium]|nr:hypothetical protein [Ilumatobacteraceae bacterium]